MNPKLNFYVHVSDPTPEHDTPPVPHGYPAVASPLSSTLIVGELDAVLVDPPWSHQHVQAIGDWIASFEKNLTAIYITHGHGDHWFGTADLLKRFPGATVYATSEVIAYIQVQHKHRAATWDARFPGQVARGEINPTLIPENGFELEGQTLRAVRLGHTDTDDTTALWVPELRLVVAGDAVYNYCHQYLNESGGSGHQDWLRALDIIESLNPANVVAGHKDKSKPNDAGSIQRTRDYLNTFHSLVECGGKSAEEAFDAMIEAFPNYANPKALWRSIVARTSETGASS